MWMEALLVILGLWAASAGPLLGKESALFEASCQLDLGRDLGQNFGTLFEVRDAAGHRIIGAGFPAVYNTYVRNERYALQFYLRPPGVELPGMWETLPKPFPSLGGAYIFDNDGALYACDYDRLRRWNAEKQAWEEAPFMTPSASERPADGLFRLGSGQLIFRRSAVYYNDHLILPPPKEGVYYRFYYALGYLCFYYTKPGQGDGLTILVACPWTPGAGPLDLAQAKMMPLTYTGETPFAWGQLRQQIVTCSNYGGFYMFDGDWHQLRAPDKRVSYQIYTMINWRDKLLMGQYPTGYLFAYDGEKITPLPGWPPVMSGVAPSVRECQSAMIYRGDLYVGVWPWAELWRYEEEAGQWHFVGRCFSQPPVTDKFQHPYEEQIRAYNEAHQTEIVVNNWGQRANSLAALGDALYIGTSAKGLFPRDERLAFLTDDVFAEYGRVLKWRLPGHISVNLKAKRGPLALRFVVVPTAMRLYAAGKLLAQQALPQELTQKLRPATVAWGEGIFGTLQGRLIRPQARFARQPQAD